MVDILSELLQKVIIDVPLHTCNHYDLIGMTANEFPEVFDSLAPLLLVHRIEFLPFSPLTFTITFYILHTFLFQGKIP